ncbi:DinB family protein [Deinococcus sonorensis]|uniref:DinB family protein n=2 Tax=Deinococcus sonorensis TaxID=309891 RepID=A0AAU7UDC1_9DEIO
MNETAIQDRAVLTTADLLTHWQGHRRLTRRVIERFPEEQLFTYSLGGMRPFGALAWELYGVSLYTLQGMVRGEWPEPQFPQALPQDRAAVLAAWDDLTGQLDEQLPKVPVERYHQPQAMFWATLPGHAAVTYAIDNEIHHRGQGYVYLRSLGLEPPPFWER